MVIGMKNFINKIWDFIVSIPKDKLLHIVVLGSITAAAILVFKSMGFEKMSCAYGWLVGFAVGVGKEIYDEVKTKSSEADDWLADFLSISCVTIYSLLLML